MSSAGRGRGAYIDAYCGGCSADYGGVVSVVIIIDRALDIEGEDMTSNFSFGKFSEVV